MANPATGSTAQAAAVLEVTPGTTPATPAFSIVRCTRSDMRNGKQTVTSAERRADRNVRNELQVAVDAGGTYNFELSYGAFDIIMQSAMFNTFAASVSTNDLVNGTTRRFHTFEEQLDIGTPVYVRYAQSMVDTFSLDINARQIITGSFSVFSLKQVIATTAITGATYTVPASNFSMTASEDFALLDVSDLVTMPLVRRVQFTINNNLRRRNTLGSLYSQPYGEGFCDITGSFEAYFNDTLLAQKVLDHGGGQLQFNLGSTAGSRYTFNFQNVKFLDGAFPVGGSNDDVILTIPFRALYNLSIGGSLNITKGV